MYAHVPELRVERAGEVQHEALCRRVGGEPRLRHEGGHAGHVEDARPGSHVRQRAIRELHRGEHEQANHVRVVAPWHVREVAERAEARVVHEQRHARAGRVGKRVPQHVERGGVREVEREGAHEAAGLLGTAGDGPNLVELPEGASPELANDLPAEPG